MKPEQKCVSLETAKKLKETGFPQEMERYWVDGEHVSLPLLLRRFTEDKRTDVYAAPDAQEILEAIPSRRQLFIDIRYADSLKQYFVENKGSSLTTQFHHANLSEALARAWLFLKEKNIT